MLRTSLALLVFALIPACGDPWTPPVDPPESFSFAVLGDAPYHGLDFMRYRHVLDEIGRDDLAFVIHVGDILWYPCTDETYRQRFEQLDALTHAVVYTPGDNEWADCHEPVAGSYLPLERLDALRDVFFAEPRESLGQSRIALQTQADDSRWPEFVENVRWTHLGVVFATIHLPGSWNAGSIFEGRSEKDDDATTRRTAAAVSWLETAFAQAEATGARALVIATHADMLLGEPADDRYRRSYEPLVERLEQLVAATARPVLLVHGDSHDYLLDQPLRDRNHGSILQQLTRLEVMGAPDVGWVRVTISGDSPPDYRFLPRVAPWLPLW